MVGIPGYVDGKMRQLSRRLLQRMNLAQLQVVVNDLHTQIEGHILPLFTFRLSENRIYLCTFQSCLQYCIVCIFCIFVLFLLAFKSHAVDLVIVENSAFVSNRCRIRYVIVCGPEADVVSLIFNSYSLDT